MKTFQQFLRENDNPLGSLGLNSTEPGEEALMRVARIAIQDHHSKTMEFFETLAKHDGRIKDDLENFKRDNANGLKKTPSPRGFGYEKLDDKRDIVAPAGADTGGSELEGN